MRQIRLIVGVLLAACLSFPTTAAAVDHHNFMVAFSAGIGGTSDADPDPGFDDIGFQLMFRMDTDHSVAFGVRVGQVELDTDESRLFDSTLSYLTLGGEYKSDEAFFESTLFLGLGAYDISGDFFVPDETGIGFVLGASGDFRINSRWSVLGEVAGHLTDLDYTNFFITANVGLAFHF